MRTALEKVTPADGSHGSDRVEHAVVHSPSARVRGEGEELFIDEELCPGGVLQDFNPLELRALGIF